MNIENTLGQVETNLKNFIQNHEAKTKDLEARLQDIEQKGSSLPLIATKGSKKATDLIISSPEIKNFIERKLPTAGVTLPLDAILNTKSVLLSDSGTNPVQQTGIITGLPTQRTSLRQLITMIPATNSTFEFLRQNGTLADFTAQAQWDTSVSPALGESGLKKETSFGFTNVSLPISTLAHYMKASSQVLSDSPALNLFLIERMRQGVEMRIEQDIIAGTGTNGQMSGLTKSGNYTAFTPVSGDTALDSINRAKVALSSANFNANLIIMNPADVGSIERAKSTTDEYIIGDPSSGGLMTLWGIPVYASNYISAGNFIMMDSSSTALWMRQEIDVRFTESNEDDFVRNVFTARAEARAGLGVLLPAGVRYGALSL